MTKLEMVIKGLEGCFDALVQSEHAIAENGVVMSSWQDRAKRIDAIREAIALLKAQEPCDFCKYSSKDDWFYLSADWDDGIGFEGHRMAYCPKCGRKLPDEK